MGGGGGVAVTGDKGCGGIDGGTGGAGGDADGTGGGIEEPSGADGADAATESSEPRAWRLSFICSSAITLDGTCADAK